MTTFKEFVDITKGLPPCENLQPHSSSPTSTQLEIGKVCEEVKQMLLEKNHQVQKDLDQAETDIRELTKKANRLLVLATRHCPSHHRDWEEVVQLLQSMNP